MCITNRVFKRLLDVTMATLLLLVATPILAVVAAMVRVKLGAPVIFCQQRPGLHGKPFWMYKLRTMTDARDARGELLPDEVRLTHFGRFLRDTSLDEIPELWNVVRGEMSLVGPRPLLMKYLTLYSSEQLRRHEVKPGVTGWAQVNGRNAIEWREKLSLDVWYVDHYSLWLDIKILFRTASTVIRQSNISKPGHATAPEFKGSQVSSVGTASLDASGVIVLGASGHARVVIAALQAAGERVLAAFDDDEALWGERIFDVPVCGPVAAAIDCGCRRAVIAIGNNRVRRQVSERLALDWITVRHPHAWVHESASLGIGTVVMAGAVVQPDVTVGSHAVINTGASVDHESRLGDFVHIAPGARLCGNVRVDVGSFVGAGATVIQGRVIDAWSIVGAGAVVISDVATATTVVGCPAGPVRDRILKMTA